MDEIKTFTNKEFGTVRTIVKDGEPWFVGKDVAEILGYSNTPKAIRDHVDGDDKRHGEIMEKTKHGKRLQNNETSWDVHRG